MFANNVPPVVLAAVSGIIGCIATLLARKAMFGQDAKISTDRWKSCALAMLLALPLALLKGTGIVQTPLLMLVLCWLVIAPSIAAKFLDSMKGVAWSELMTLNATYAFVTLAVYLLAMEGYASLFVR